jgi:hypothetical protein
MGHKSNLNFIVVAFPAIIIPGRFNASDTWKEIMLYKLCKLFTKWYLVLSIQTEIVLGIHLTRV